MNTIFVHQNNHGSLFVADKKSPQAPDRRGTAVIDNVEYQVSAWIKEGPRGKYLSLAFTKKDAPRTLSSSADDPDW